MSDILVGKTLTGIALAEGNLAIKFITTEGDIVAECDADCCSSTWIEHVELPALGFPATVLSAEALDLPGSEDDHPVHDCLQVYGLKVTTDKGDLIIDYRNSSNGYYGGWLSFPSDHKYGGVWNQQDYNPDQWTPVTADI